MIFTLDNEDLTENVKEEVPEETEVSISEQPLNDTAKGKLNFNQSNTYFEQIICLEVNTDPESPTPADKEPSQDVLKSNEDSNVAVDTVDDNDNIKDVSLLIADKNKISDRLLKSSTDSPIDQSLDSSQKVELPSATPQEVENLDGDKVSLETVESNTETNPDMEI